MSAPVRSNCKHINTESFNILDLLAFIFFDDHQIGETRFFNSFDSLYGRLVYIKFSSRTVKLVRCHSNNQIVTKGASPLKKCDMPLV